MQQNMTKRPIISKLLSHMSHTPSICLDGLNLGGYHLGIIVRELGTEHLNLFPMKGACVGVRRLMGDTKQLLTFTGEYHILEIFPTNHTSLLGFFMSFLFLEGYC